MLIRLRVTLDGTDMNSTLVGECGISDISLMLGRSKVCQLVDVARQIPQLSKLFVADTIFLHLQFKRRDDRAEICIAASFAEAVDCALNLYNPEIHSDQRVCNSALAIVVGMNAERSLYLFFYFADNFRKLKGRCAAVGVAQYDTVDFCLFGCLERF